jgi:hypothetical protein
MEEGNQFTKIQLRGNKMNDIESSTSFKNKIKRLLELKKKEEDSRIQFVNALNENQNGLREEINQNHSAFNFITLEFIQNQIYTNALTEAKLDLFIEHFSKFLGLASELIIDNQKRINVLEKNEELIKHISSNVDLLNGVVADVHEMVNGFAEDSKNQGQFLEELKKYFHQIDP